MQQQFDLAADTTEGEPPDHDSLVTTAELLRVGLLAGRKYIEKPKPARKRKDQQTYDMFDTMPMF